MNMKKKAVSLIMSLALAASAIASIPALVGAEAYVNQEEIYVNNSDFTDVSAGVPGLQITIDGQPWLFKGSAGVHTETYMSEKDMNYVNFKSDSKKAGVDGEGSWYFYNRNEKKPMAEYGFTKFDIRLQSGIVNLDMGDFTDPTKGNANLAAEVIFDASTGSIKAKTVSDKMVDVVSSGIETGKWYTVQVDINAKLQEYTVTVTDPATGKELGKAEELVFVQKACEVIKTTCFSYVRKTYGHEFDLTNITVARIKASELKIDDGTSTPAPTATPTPAPTATPTPVPTAKPVTFKDIDGHWAKDFVVEMAQAEVINGMDESTFAPDAQITRSQFIKLVVATLKLDTTAAYAGVATDVKDHWAANYVQAAEKAGLIDSAFVVDSKLNPDQDITREEMASLVTRAAKSKNLDVAGGSVDVFEDKDTISAWAKDDVAGAVKLEIVKGMTDTEFAPTALATRAQAATMMSRLLEKIK